MPESSNPSPADWKSTMSAYRSSAAYNRWFCTTCGTHMVFEDTSGALAIATGTIDAETSDDVIDFKGHMYLQFSKDGGASDFLRTINDKPTERWLVEAEKSKQVPQDFFENSPVLAEERNRDSIPLHCHCNRVQLRITRPTEASKSVPPPPPDYPDIIIPAHSGRDIKTKHGVCWWLSEDHKRYLAGTCTCQSCRLGTGFDIMSWSFIPLLNIEFPDGSAIQGTDEGLEADERVAKMMRLFKSKTLEGVKRYFCPNCGASVLWFSPTRPKLLDVATALLDAPSGVRAEEFLEWHTKRVSYREEALHRGLMEGLEKGLKEWKAERNTRAA